MKKRLAGIGLLGIFTASAFAQPAEWGSRDRDDRFRNDDRYRYEERYEPHRGRDAAIIGGSAAAGAVIGGLAGHGTGAVVGAIAGGLVGAVADHAGEHHDWR